MKFQDHIRSQPPARRVEIVHQIIQHGRDRGGKTVGECIKELNADEFHALEAIVIGKSYTYDATTDRVFSRAEAGDFPEKVLEWLLRNPLPEGHPLTSTQPS
ncbi:MAG TPA: hypothetical protein VKT73_15195 [Xanthobacteraceae bacterium]|nr:hypothetical protein [Xanthobacteraceae bacterium]